VLQSVLFHLFRGVVVSVIPFGFSRHDLIKKLALTVLLARLRVSLGHSDGFAKDPSVLGCHHDHASTRGASRISCHSSAEKSDFVVIASPIVLHSLMLVTLTVANGFREGRAGGI
jgi:hypothetical protein